MVEFTLSTNLQKNEFTTNEIISHEITNTVINY